MKLTIIGASGSFPGPGSPASCYLVTADGVAEDGVTPKTWRILLDMGNGSLGTLQRYIMLEDLDGVCLSHLHPDHFMDLCGLHVAVRWNPDGWHRGRVPVLGPTGTAERIAVAYGMDPEPGMHPDFDFTTWEPLTTVRLGPFRITPHPVRHPIDEAYALRIEVDETDADGSATTRVLTYSGDTDECDGLVEAARGADVFVCEAAFQEDRDAARGIHLTGLRAGRVADAAEAKNLVLTHIPPWTDACMVRAEAAAEFSGPIELARPGNTWQL